MVIRVSDKKKNNSKVTKLLVKPYLNKLFGLDDSFRSGIKKSVTQFKATKSMWDLAKAKKNGENLEEKAKATVDAFGATIIGDRTQFKDAADQALAGYDLD